MAEQNTKGPKAGQKVALVTGAGVGGIGGSLAIELHSAGYFVICAVRRPSSASELLRPGMMAIELDVSSTDSVSAAVNKVSSIANDKLHVLINNAGSATHRPALDLDVDGVVASMFDVNVLGVMRMVKGFSDLLINARGCIVNIGSIAPIVPLVYSSAYNASKAALHAYGDSLRMELKPFGYYAFRFREDSPSLPEGSRYLPLQDSWLHRVTMSQKGAMDTDEYARKVVGMIQKKSKPIWFWSGGSVSIAWFMYYFVPRSVRLFVMARRFGLIGKKLL
ncbi:oxidoreductase,short chain dehydrogenase, putative [Metarhizium acridum CQMa 102]|uniref:Hydroxynaphthalene reductase-like protein Arp2 n=1 Tax=Metarhizium acridum (strain CQMa 102) TaxID=655827 RepID=E9EH10_METAQ|nr:oxidoreductase,short chain dehydrogenase, putative [Metarhizium acridum CQMa 102]EFY84795.1 oxidoreductase,short chain dehydrogenase, putative [Metarhizium acridum CQMa 102]